MIAVTSDRSNTRAVDKIACEGHPQRIDHTIERYIFDATMENIGAI